MLAIPTGQWSLLVTRRNLRSQIYYVISQTSELDLGEVVSLDKPQHMQKLLHHYIALLLVSQPPVVYRPFGAKWACGHLWSLWISLHEQAGGEHDRPRGVGQYTEEVCEAVSRVVVLWSVICRCEDKIPICREKMGFPTKLFHRYVIFTLQIYLP